MVKIPTYEAKQGYEPYNLPRVSPDALAAPGRAVEGLGQNLGNLAGAFDAARKRSDQQAEFNANTQIEILNEKSKQKIIEEQRAAPADGQGITQNTLKWYNDERGKLVKDLPPDIAAKITEKLDLQQLRVENDAANTEWTQGNKHSTDTINQSSSDAASETALDPAQFDLAMKRVEDLIDSAPNMTAAGKEEAKRNLKTLMQGAQQQGLIRTDPETAQFMHGSTDNKGRYRRAAELLKDAVIHQESGGNPNAVSPAGAVGKMQVMPATAYQIATEIGDQAYLMMGDDARIRYLKDPGVSERYGMYYLNQQLERYNGNQAMALAAYNAGPGAVDKAIKRAAKAGKPDAWLTYLPKETQNYVPAIMARRGNAKFIDSAEITKPVIVMSDGSVTSQPMVVVQGADGKFATMPQTVDGKKLSESDLTHLYDTGVVKPFATYNSREEAETAADPKTPAIASEDAANKPFFSPSLAGSSPAQIAQWASEAKSATTDREKAVEQQKEADTKTVQQKIDEDVGTMASDGKGSIKTTDIPAMEAAILSTQGKDGQATLDKWHRDRALARQKYDATHNLWTQTEQEIQQGMRDLTDPSRSKSPDQEAVIKDFLEKAQAVEELRRKDPGQAVLNVPEVAEAWRKIDANDKASRIKYLQLAEYWQNRLGFHSNEIPRLLPNKAIYPLVDQFRTSITDPLADMAAVTNQTLDRFREHYGEYGDDIFKHVNAESMDDKMSASTRLVVSSTLADWMEQHGGNQPTQPGANSSTDAAKQAAELAASQKAISQQQQNEAEKSSSGWWDWLFPKSEETPTPLTPEQQNVPPGNTPSDIMDDKGNPVPQEALDHMIKYWPNNTMEKQFIETFGEKAHDEAVKRARDKKKPKKPETTPPAETPGVEGEP